ncbi:hypothetical protein TNCV_3693041 [Trichonephila clavipes]|nr:hypothetical protein TNCV_3693041 [Trichonephila clavipes]
MIFCVTWSVVEYVSIEEALMEIEEELMEIEIPFYSHPETHKDPLDTLRKNCGIIRKQPSTDGGVLWKVVRVNVVQVRRKDRSLSDPRGGKIPC